MAELDIDISAQQSTCLDDGMLAEADLVVTLCGDADEQCPVLPAGTRRIHWPLPDPAKASGCDAEIMARFRAVRDDIEQRVKSLLADELEPSQ